MANKQDTQEITTIETGTENTVEEKTFKSRKGEMSSVVPERDEIGGYITSKKAAYLLSLALDKEIPVTTVNNLAYAGKVDCFKISSVFLFKETGENSITEYVPVLKASMEKKSNKSVAEERKNKTRKADELHKKYIKEPMSRGERPDFDTYQNELAKLG